MPNLICSIRVRDIKRILVDRYFDFGTAGLYSAVGECDPAISREKAK